MGQNEERRSLEDHLDKETLEGKGIPLWQHVLAGSFAGAVEHMVTFPLDAMATRAHLRKLHPDRQLPPFFSGFWPTVLGAIPAHAAMFSTFEVVKQNLSRRPGLSRFADSIAGVASACAHDVIDGPVTVLKRRMQSRSTDSTMGDRPKQVVSLVAGTVTHDLFMSLFGQIPENIIANALLPAFGRALRVDEALQRTTQHHEAPTALQKLANRTIQGFPVGAIGRHFAAHGLSGAIAAGLCSPLENVRTVLCTQHEAGKRMKVGAAMQKMRREHGLQGLYTGVLPRSIGAFPENALSWGTFELVESLLKRINSK